jgi:hypothetical protein
MESSLERVTAIYRGSDGAATKALYAEMEAFGAAGVIAMNLFRAQKNSERAKKYRGGIRGVGSYRDMAYDRKQWAMENLCSALIVHSDRLALAWGWKLDAGAFGPAWVLYVDVPGIGQVSFHSPSRGDGPDYRGHWDGERGASVQRVIEFTARVLGRSGDSSDQAVFGFGAT